MVAKHVIRLGAPLMIRRCSEGQTLGDTDFSLLSHACQSSLIMQIHSANKWPLLDVCEGQDHSNLTFPHMPH